MKEHCFGMGRFESERAFHEGRRFAWEGGFRGRRAGRGGHRGFAGQGERMFESGDVKLVVLKLIAEQPSYGYQIIKALEDRLAGGYVPSAGVIYPTLTLLEEEDLAEVVDSDSKKKVYRATPQGLECLATSKERVDELFARLDHAGEKFERGRSPEIMRAFANLRGAVVGRVARESITPEQIRSIAEAINAAARTIEEL